MRPTPSVCDLTNTSRGPAQVFCGPHDCEEIYAPAGLSAGAVLSPRSTRALVSALNTAYAGPVCCPKGDRQQMAFVHDSFSTDQPSINRSQPTLDALWDALLLVLALSVAADMFVNFGKTIFSGLWLLCYGLAIVRIVVTWPYFLSALARNAIVIAYPVICLSSVLWSPAPIGTLVSSVQLMMTILIGIYLGWRYSLDVLLFYFAVILSVAAALSLLHLATGIFPWPTHTGAGGLAGLFQHKNLLGMRSAFCVVIVLALMMLRRGEIGWAPRSLLILAAGIASITMVLSESMSSLLLMPVMIGIVLLLCLKRVPVLVAIFGLAFVILSIVLGPVILVLAGIDPVDAVLSGVGKDATLTGRTVLWDIALDTYRQHPILGTGFRGFWIAPEFASGRAQTHAAGARDVSSFHNFALEILVSVGPLGLLAMLGTIATTGRRLTRLFLRDQSPIIAAAIALLVATVAMSFLDTSLFRGHEIMILLLAATCVSAGESLAFPRVHKLP